jgi:hypothetical protein
MPKAAHFFATAPQTVFLVAAMVCATARGVEPEPTPESRAHFQAGVSYLEEARYSDAHREFAAAYAITPRWTALGNLGVAAMHLERDGEAIDAFEQYLERGGADIGAREARRARERLEQLRTRFAAVVIEAPGTFWIVDTRVDPSGAVVNEYGPFEGRAELRVRAGEHQLKLERASLHAPVWKATLLAGDVARHSFVAEIVSMPPVSDLPDPDGFREDSPETDAATASHMTSYALWGAGAAGAFAAVVVALEANRIQEDADRDFERRCPSLATGEPGCEKVTAGGAKAANWRTGALLTGIGAFGLLVGGTIIYFLDEPSNTTSASTEASLQPWISPNGIGVAGTF